MTDDCLGSIAILFASINVLLLVIQMNDVNERLDVIVFLLAYLFHLVING